MKLINEANLPGVGRKLWLESSDGGRISIIAYNGGEYEIYLTPQGEEFPTSAVRLTPEEATALGSAFPSSKSPGQEVLMPDTTCIVVSANSSVLGVDAASLKSGSAFVAAVTTVADDCIRIPSGHTIAAADILYLMGRDEDREALAEHIRHHA